MTQALRKINQLRGGNGVLSTQYNGLLAEKILSETTGGDSGNGALYNEAIDNPGVRLSMVITSFPSVGKLFVKDNGEIDASEFPDGVYSVPYDFYIEGVYQGAAYFTLTFGATGNIVASGASIASGTAGLSTGVALSGAGSSVASGTAVIDQGLDGALQASGTVAATGSGTLAVSVDLAAVGQVVASATAGITNITLSEGDLAAITALITASIPNITASVLASLQENTLSVNVAKVNNVVLVGSGQAGDSMRPS